MKINEMREHIDMMKNLNSDDPYNFYDLRYPRAGDVVDGLVVRDDVPNLESISSSSTDYKVLKGLREVPFSDFDADIRRTSRVEALARAIEDSGEINPLIVMVEIRDEDGGPYILEGSHRFDALQIIGKKSFPAIVVIDYQFED